MPPRRDRGGWAGHVRGHEPLLQRAGRAAGALHQVVSDVWCVVCGVWCVVCGVWCVVCGGVWVVCGVWCVVCGVWCVV